MNLTINVASAELINLKNSWKERGLPPEDALVLLASMIARFALANHRTVDEACNDINGVIRVVYDDLENQLELARLLNSVSHDIPS